ncbi:MAG: APC family permease [Acidobacteriota bacterium]
MSQSPTPLRAMTFGHIVALGINCVIGSGVFLLPGLAAEGLGPASVLAVLAAGLLIFLIALCFAEVGSRFDGSGGAYRYAREAFGDLVGFEVGWLAMLAGILAWGALIDAVTVALSVFIPEVASGWPRAAVIVGVMAAFAVFNLRGVALGARASTTFSVVKVAAMLAFVVFGTLHVDAATFSPFAPSGWGAFGGAVVLYLYAYLGFENLVVPAGEMRDPGRAVPWAVTTIMASVTLLYVVVQTVAVGTLGADLSGMPNAVAAAAEVVLGPVGGKFVAAGILVSILGVNAASAIVGPRRVSAMADDGALPRVLGKVHPTFRTPWAAIFLVYGGATLVALTGSFRELVVIAVVARFLQYAPTCAAAIALRRQDDVPPARFLLPGGPIIPVLALLLSTVLLLRAAPIHLVFGLIAAFAGLPVWWWQKRREQARSSS